MSEDKAIYINNFPHPLHGSLQPLRLGGESNLRQGETMSDAWDRMHKEAIEWHRTRFGGSAYMIPEGSANVKPNEIYQYKTPDIQVEISNDSKETKEGIKSSQSVDQLTSYKLLASKDKELMSLYMNRLKELTNAEIR